MAELQTRCFVGDITEDVEASVTVTEWAYDDGTAETVNEDYELDGRAVTIGDLSKRFGARKVLAFIENAVQHAR